MCETKGESFLFAYCELFKNSLKNEPLIIMKIKYFLPLTTITAEAEPSLFVPVHRYTPIYYIYV